MVKTIRFLILLCFLVALKNIKAQRLETGLKILFSSEKLHVDDKVFAPVSDSLTSVFLSSNKRGNSLGYFFKFYPKNNKLFFYQDFEFLGALKQEYQYSYSYLKPNGEKSSYNYSNKYTVDKLSTNIFLGYDLIKTRKTKMYVSGGMKLSTISIGTSGGVIDPEMLNRITEDPKYPGKFYNQLPKNIIGFVVSGGLKSNRLFVDARLNLNPFIKKTEGLSLSHQYLNVNIGWVLTNKNKVVNQYEKKKEAKDNNKINKSSAAKVTLSLFTDYKIISRTSEFEFSDQIPFHYNAQHGYIDIHITKRPKVRERMCLGFAYQINLPKKLYLKNLYSINFVSYLHSDSHSGGYFSQEPNSIIQYRTLDNANSKFTTNGGHFKTTFAIGYNYNQNSFFAEAGIDLNSWKFQTNKFVENSSGTVIEIKDTDIKTKITARKLVLGAGITAGYKFNNLSLFANFNTTFQSISKRNDYGIIGKYTEVKIGIAYQFLKFYTDKK